MKTKFYILAGLGLWALGFSVSAQVQYREATLSEVAAGAQGLPAIVTPRRLAGLIGPTNGITSAQATNIANARIAASGISTTTNASALTVGTLAYERLPTNIISSANPDDFTVTNSTLSLKNDMPILSGTYVSLNTNLALVFTNGFAYGTNQRVTIATVPSVASVRLLGVNVNFTLNPSPPTGYAAPYTPPQLQYSTDGGVNWDINVITNRPAVISLFMPFPVPGVVTGLVVNSYLNTVAIGSTNDLKNQVVLVSQTADNFSAVNVTGAHAIGADEAASWANYSAVASVNLAGNDLIPSSVWKVSFTNSAVTWKYKDSNVLTFQGATSTNTAPTVLSAAKSGTNFLIEVESALVPSIQYRTNLSVGSWVGMTAIASNQNAASWTITAAIPVVANEYFFRAYASAPQSSPAVVTINAALMLKANAWPVFTGNDGGLVNSNKVLYWVTATSTNKLAP